MTKHTWKTMSMNTQAQCYAAGKRAFREGALLTDNPQDRVTYGYHEWRRGWLERCYEMDPDSYGPAIKAEKAAHEAADAKVRAEMEAIYGKVR